MLASFARAPGPGPRPCPRKIILQKCATIPKRCPPSNQKLTCHPNILRSMFKLFRPFRVLLETLNFLTLSPDAAPKLVSSKDTSQLLPAELHQAADVARHLSLSSTSISGADA